MRSISHVAPGYRSATDSPRRARLAALALALSLLPLAAGTYSVILLLLPGAEAPNTVGYIYVSGPAAVAIGLIVFGAPLGSIVSLPCGVISYTAHLGPRGTAVGRALSKLAIVFTLLGWILLLGIVLSGLADSAGRGAGAGSGL